MTFSPWSWAWHLGALAGTPQVPGRTFVIEDEPGGGRTFVVEDEPGGGSSALVKRIPAESSLVPGASLSQHEVLHFVMSDPTALAALRKVDPKITALPPKLLSGQAIEQRLAKLPLNPLSFHDVDYSIDIYGRAIMGALASLVLFSLGGLDGELSRAFIPGIGLAGSMFGILCSLGMEYSDAQYEAKTTGEKRRVPWFIEGFMPLASSLLTSMGMAQLVSGLTYHLIATPLAAIVAPGCYLVRRFFQRKKLEDGLQSLQALAANHEVIEKLFWNHPELIEEYVSTWLPKRLEAQIDALKEKRIPLDLERETLTKNLAELQGLESMPTTRVAAEEVRAGLRRVEQRLETLTETKIPRAEQNLRDLAPIQERAANIVAEWKEAQRIEQIRSDAIETQVQSGVRELETTTPGYRIGDVQEIVSQTEELVSITLGLNEYLAAAEEE